MKLHLYVFVISSYVSAAQKLSKFVSPLTLFFMGIKDDLGGLNNAGKRRRSHKPSVLD